MIMRERICSINDGSEEKCTVCREFFRCGILSGECCLWVRTEDDVKREWADRTYHANIARGLEVIG